MNYRYTPLDELSRLGEIREHDLPPCEPFTGADPFPLDPQDFAPEPVEENRAAQAVRDLRRKYRMGKRRFTAKDFYRICKGEGIRILANPECKGLFDICRGLRGLTFAVRTRSGETLRAISMRCLFEVEFDRFCAAHELGHAMFKHTAPTMLLALDDFEAYKNHPEEIEANRFAELLIATI